MRERLRAVIKSKTIGEMLGNITWDMLEAAAFIPLFMLVLSPLYQLLSDLLFGRVRGLELSFSITMRWVTSVAWAVGSLILLVYTGKKIIEKASVRQWLSEREAAWLFGAFVVWMLISTAVNGFTTLAVHGDAYRQESVFTYIMYIAVYFVCGAFIRNMKYRELLIYVFIMVSTALAVFGAVVPHPDFYSGKAIAMVFHHFNHYGYYLTISILLSGVMLLYDKRRWARVLCAVLFSLGIALLIVNDTFGCYLAVFIGLVFACVVMSICKRGGDVRPLSLIGVFVLISVLMSIKDDVVINNLMSLFGDVIKMNEQAAITCGTGTGRGILYIRTLDYIDRSPVFGYGAEGIAERLAIDTRGVCDRPHNEILQYAAFFGVPAAVMYVGGVLAVYLKGLKNRAHLDAYAVAALVAAFGYLVSSMFGNTTHYITPYLFMLLGMGYVIREK